jgi:purine-binding chemotaxis protein CheW
MSQSSSQPVAQGNSAGLNNVQQFLTFVLSDEVYGVGILHIREIIEYDNLTIVPLMPDFISGVINLRGNVVPVVNLARRFEHQPKEIGKRTSMRERVSRLASLLMSSMKSSNWRIPT